MPTASWYVGLRGGGGAGWGGGGGAGGLTAALAGFATSFGAGFGARLAVFRGTGFFDLADLAVRLGLARFGRGTAGRGCLFADLAARAGLRVEVVRVFTARRNFAIPGGGQ
jgi:hypothetical protein